MKTAVFLGAGASKGSQSVSPPLGSEVFSKISGMVQSRRIKVVQSAGMQEFGHYSADDIVVQENIELGRWIQDAYPDAAKAFEQDFEEGMGLLRELKPRSGGWGPAILTSSNEIITPFMDWTLSQRVMVSVASHLFKYSPADNSLYFDLLAALPEGSSIFTLNYDTLIEEAAAALCYNLEEPSFVRTSCLTKPEKHLYFYQLHGGCTLFEGFTPPIPSMGPGLVAATDEIYRLRKSPVLLDKDPLGGLGSTRMTLSSADYDKIFAARAQLAYFRDDKFSPLGGAYPKSCFEAYNRILANEDYSVFFCGCRYHPVDKHIWRPVVDAKAKLYWCGDKSALDHLPAGSEFIESRFSPKTLDKIRQISN